MWFILLFCLHLYMDYFQLWNLSTNLQVYTFKTSYCNFARIWIHVSCYCQLNISTFTVKQIHYILFCECVNHVQPTALHIYSICTVGEGSVRFHQQHTAPTVCTWDTVWSVYNRISSISPPMFSIHTKMFRSKYLILSPQLLCRVCRCVLVRCACKSCILPYRQISVLTSSRVACILCLLCWWREDLEALS